ncbi:MAG: type II toxin-antitoxin system RelE/ParE family toxin [Betaproteobacteria bacterium]|nr:type II toxin-antitoxin system RelE/ParE family toxin [Betaproteobacteria bacterium]
MAAKRRWTIRLGASAEADFQNILRWTASQFGPRQAHVYAQTLTAAITALGDGPTVIGAKARDDIAKGLYTLHVVRNGRKGRHFVMFRVAQSNDADVIDVLRVLHDAMNLPRHVPPLAERE